MFGLGKLIATPLHILNVPLRVCDAALDYAEGGDGNVRTAEHVLGQPLKVVADAIEEAIDGEDD